MTPKTEQELAACIQSATAPLRIVGGGTRQTLGGCADSDATLSTRALSGITLYEPEALTLIAKAGTPVQEIEAALAAENQHLSFEPMNHQSLLGTIGTPTIGGVVACNVSGPRRIQAGACRDSLIGVRFVDGLGRCLKNGGRVMKNVTGYDLVKLMAGSMGTLGVLTEVAFKVLPAPETSAVLLMEGLSDALAVQALSKALSSPYEISGAAHIQKGLVGNPMTMIRIEGFEKSVAYRITQLQNLLSEYGESAIETDPVQTKVRWQELRDVESFADQPGDVWRISVKPADGPEVARKLPEADCIFDWGGGLIWALAPEKTDIRKALNGISGFAERVRGTAQDLVPARVAQNPIVARIEQGLRDKFDPKGILNAGIMG